MGQTVHAVRLALGERDARAVGAAVAGGYLVAYLVAVGHLGAGDGDWGLLVVSDPLSRALEPVSAYSFEPVALLELGPVEYRLAPLNLAIGGILAGLVALNAGLAWLAWRRPACGVERSAGVFAGVPALFSGAACCGPALLLVLGVQASGALLVAVSWLVPASGALLLVGVVLAARSVGG